MRQMHQVSIRLTVLEPAERRAQRDAEDNRSEQCVEENADTQQRREGNELIHRPQQESLWRINIFGKSYSFHRAALLVLGGSTLVSCRKDAPLKLGGLEGICGCLRLR